MFSSISVDPFTIMLINIRFLNAGNSLEFIEKTLTSSIDTLRNWFKVKLCRVKSSKISAKANIVTW